MNEVSFEFKAIGTSWFIRFVYPERTSNQELGEVEGPSSEYLMDLIKHRIETFEQHYSRFREDSFVGRIAQKEGVYELPTDAEVLFALYRKFYDITDGKVTPLIGEVLVAAGYDKDYSLTPQETIPTAPAWDDILRYQVPFLTVKKPVKLDFGGLGKGYIVDIVSSLLQEHGIRDYTVNAGGDIAYSTSKEKPYIVGLEDPTDNSLVIGEALLINKSIAGSAGNRRAWNKYHHIIDPELTESPRHISAVWVVADTTILADGLTTALFFSAPELLQQHFEFEYLIVYADRSAKVSQNFPGMVYS